MTKWIKNSPKFRDIDRDINFLGLLSLFRLTQANEELASLKLIQNRPAWMSADTPRKTWLLQTKLLITFSEHFVHLGRPQDQMSEVGSYDSSDDSHDVDSDVDYGDEEDTKAQEETTNDNRGDDADFGFGAGVQLAAMKDFEAFEESDPEDALVAQKADSFETFILRGLFPEADGNYQESIKAMLRSSLTSMGQQTV